MLTQFSRTELTFGASNMEKLFASRVIVFGLGGVGSYVAEALSRSGVGALDLVDDDRICLTNLNRQLYALHSTIGRRKVDVASERIHDINPQCKVSTHAVFFLPEHADEFDFSRYDYVVDCIDTVTAKIQLVVQAGRCGVPVISCMGAGNKVDPGLLEVSDISATSVCPLARVMRQELRKRGVEHLKVVYSREPSIPPVQDGETGCKSHCVCPPGTKRTCAARNEVPGSNAFVPAAAGLLIASEVVRDITGFHRRESQVPKNARTQKAPRRPVAGQSAATVTDGGFEAGSEWL